MTQFGAGYLVWQTVAAALAGLNVGVFSEAWTNWNLAFFGFQALLLACCFRKILRLQQLLVPWIAKWLGHDA